MRESFNVYVGVRQGDKLSVILFKLVLYYNVNKLYRGNISNKTFQINAYADDVVTISRNLKALEEALQELDNT
jgi:fumarate reductase subunit C